MTFRLGDKVLENLLKDRLSSCNHAIERWTKAHCGIVVADFLLSPARKREKLPAPPKSDVSAGLATFASVLDEARFDEKGVSPDTSKIAARAKRLNAKLRKDLSVPLTPAEEADFAKAVGKIRKDFEDAEVRLRGACSVRAVVEEARNARAAARGAGRAASRKAPRKRKGA